MRMNNQTITYNQNNLEDRRLTQPLKTRIMLTSVVLVQCLGYVILHSFHVSFVKQFKNALWMVAMVLSLLNSCSHLLETQLSQDNMLQD
jgi:hypothetical protein